MLETLAGPAVRPRLASIPHGATELSSSEPDRARTGVTAQHSLNTLTHTDTLKSNLHAPVCV